MINRIYYPFWLTLALISGSLLADDGIHWRSDVEQGRRLSSQYGVPLLLHFYGDQCLPCKTLEQRVYSRSELVGVMNRYFICVKVNASERPDVAAEYQVHSLPSDVFFSPDGEKLLQEVCQQDPRNYLTTLTNAATMSHDRTQLLAANKSHAPTEATYFEGERSDVSPESTAPSLPSRSMYANEQNDEGIYGARDNERLAIQRTSEYASQSNPRQDVVVGPVTASQQPRAIATSSQAKQHQVEGAGKRYELHTGAEGLPARNRSAQIQAPSSPSDYVSQADDKAYSQQLPPHQSFHGKQGLSISQNGEGGPQFPSLPEPKQPHTPTDWPQSESRLAKNANSRTTAADRSSNSGPTLIDNPFHPLYLRKPPEENAPAMDYAASSTQASQPVSGRNVSAQVVANHDRMAKPNAGQERTPAMQGYCPIALKNQGEWVPGDRRHAIRHRGQVFWLSSAEAARRFKSAPDAASPVFGGYDPMTFLQQGTLESGSIQHGLVVEATGNILLFQSEASKQAFAADRQRNLAALETVMQQAGLK